MIFPIETEALHPLKTEKNIMQPTLLSTLDYGDNLYTHAAATYYP